MRKKKSIYEVGRMRGYGNILIEFVSKNRQKTKEKIIDKYAFRLSHLLLLAFIQLLRNSFFHRSNVNRTTHLIYTHDKHTLYSSFFFYYSYLLLYIYIFML